MQFGSDFHGDENSHACRDSDGGSDACADAYSDRRCCTRGCHCTSS